MDRFSDHDDSELSIKKPPFNSAVDRFWAPNQKIGNLFERGFLFSKFFQKNKMMMMHQLMKIGMQMHQQEEI